MNRLRIFLSVLVLSSVTAWADTASIVAKARAYLGTEQALSAVKSLRYAGTVESVDKQEDGTEKKISSPVEIIFQKPTQHRTEVTLDQTIETIALDDYEAWQQVRDKKDVTRWRTVLFQKNQVKKLRAACWENLSFFRGIEDVGGTLTDEGVVQIDGKSAHKLVFTHGPDIVYVRYFDDATGKLLLSETDQGMKIREEGEFTVSGIRFPKRIVQTTTGPDGKDHVVTITIDQVTVNQDFPAELFRVPLPPPK